MRDNSFMLPVRFRPFGFILIGIGFILGLLRFNIGVVPESLYQKVYAFLSLHFEPVYFKVIKNQLLEEILLFQNHTEWLYTKVLETGLFRLDLGSFVYLWIGFMLFLLITASKSKQKWLWFGFIILLYGIIKYLFLLHMVDFFKPDSIKALISDVIACFSGAAISFYFLNNKRFVPGSIFFKRLLALFSILTFSFLWVGFYQYHYNVNLNTQGLNLWAFSLWTLGGIMYFEGYRKLRLCINNPYFRILTILSIYYFVLFSIEYLAFYTLHIRENSLSNGKPLAFGLIHGTPVLHIYYVSYPFTVYLFYQFLTFVSKKAQIELNKSSVLPSENKVSFQKVS